MDEELGQELADDSGDDVAVRPELLEVIDAHVAGRVGPLEGLAHAVHGPEGVIAHDRAASRPRAARAPPARAGTSSSSSRVRFVACDPVATHRGSVARAAEALATDGPPTKEQPIPLRKRLRRAALDQVPASSSVSATRKTRYDEAVVERVGSGKSGMASAKVRLVLEATRTGLACALLICWSQRREGGPVTLSDVLVIGGGLRRVERGRRPGQGGSQGHGARSSRGSMPAFVASSSTRAASAPSPRSASGT